MVTSEIYGSKGLQLEGKRILIGVTGSIAAIEVPHLIREIIRYSGEPIVVLSQEATRFVAIDSLTWCMDKTPYTEITGLSEHVKWTFHPDYKIDLFLICPASANTIAKLAHGIADGPVTLAALAAYGAGIPMLIVPAAHTVLLDNPIMEQNIQKLQNLGIHFQKRSEIENKYKFPPISVLMDQIFNLIDDVKPLKGKKFLLTGGATREFLDDVRFISNPSSGLSANSLANALIKFGAELKLIIGANHSLNLSTLGFSYQVVQSTSDMLEAVEKELSSTSYDALISVAAVSDYKPIYKPGKIKSQQENLVLELTPTKKMIKTIRERYHDLYIVAYKAEVGVSEDELINRAKAFMEKNKVQMVCANWVGELGKGFEAQRNDIIILLPNSTPIVISDSKTQIGIKIAEIIITDFSRRKMI